MAEAPDAGEAEALPLFEGQDVYCLLVDDDPLQLALTEELLKQSHVQVVGCTNPHNVLELLRNTVFNAIHRYTDADAGWLSFTGADTYVRYPRNG